MRKKNVDAIREAAAKALGAQVERTLNVMRIRGWDFPSECDVGVTIISTSPLALTVALRMSDIRTIATISNTNAADDVALAVDDLVAPWLVKYATARP